MTLDADIRGILEAAIRAPSGENSQPWRFRIDGERIYLYNQPEADQSLYNFHQNGSLVSHGAVLTNMRIAAAHFGYEVNAAIFPDEKEENLVATIGLVKKEATQLSADGEALYAAIAQRKTNRKHYDGKPLTESEKKDLMASATGNASATGENTRIILIDDREKINEIARAASTNETMLVLNRNVHDFFFSHVRWTREENDKQPNGFFVDTLELNPEQAKGFKMLKRWGMARILGAFGVAKVVGRDNEAAYRSASTIVAITVPDPRPRNMIAAGEVFERAWLTATKLGLSVQPSTGALFLAEGIPHENWDKFSATQRDSLLAAKKAIYEAVNVAPQREHVAVIFRVGRSDPPTAQASRFPLETFLQP